MDLLALIAFLVSATALLGSPGPGIAALVTIGRAEGLARGLRYYSGLQVGLAAAAALSAAGLVSVLLALPALVAAMTWIATAYLVYLAWCIATAPVGTAIAGSSTPSSPLAGMLLGIANPKAYAAFTTLFASHRVLADDAQGDMLLKWVLCVLVILVVDLAWLLAGVGLGKAALRPATERALNRLLGGLIVGAALLMHA